MKIRYLGTAAAEGCPALFCRCGLCRTAREHGGKDVRTRSQVLIDDSLLVDFPPDTYHHFLNTPEFDLPGIRHILITHSHADHFYPLDAALRCNDFAQDVDGIMTLYGNDSVQATWERTITGEYAVFKDLPNRVTYQPLLPFIPVQAGDHLVTALPADHKRDENCYIYIIERKGKRLLYANDTGTNFKPEVWDYLKNLHFDGVSMDCTAMDRRVGRYHMGLPDNAELKAKLFEIGSADESTLFIVTHFSHFGGLTHEELARRARSLGFETAYDGLALLI